MNPWRCDQADHQDRSRYYQHAGRHNPQRDVIDILAHAFRWYAAVKAQGAQTANPKSQNSEHNLPPWRDNMSHYIEPEALAGNTSGESFSLGLPVLFQGSKPSERPALQAASFENCGPLFAAAHRP
jgi:hypothetical protein